MTATEESTERIPAATPALALADLLDAVSAHLRKHPHLPPVNVDRFSNSLQIAGTVSLGWTDESALLSWAESMDTPSIAVFRYENPTPEVGKYEVVVSIRASVYHCDVELWCSVASGDWFDLDPGQQRDASISDLRILAAASIEVAP